MQLIAEACYRHGISPELITRNQRILQLAITKYNINFIDSIQYVMGSLDSLTTTFKLDSVKGYFPHEFNQPNNYGYKGICPPAKSFISFNDSSKQIEKKEKFCQELEETNYIWNFQNEIAAYCNQDVNVLCQAMCKFLKQALLFQVELHNKVELESNIISLPKLLNPFTPNFLTLSSWVFGVWRQWFLPKYEIYSMKDDKGLTSIQTSQAEQEVVLFEQWRNPKAHVQSSFTSPTVARFGRIVPDYFIKETKVAGWIHGCYFHCHRFEDGCLDRTESDCANNQTKNFTGATFQSMTARFSRHQKMLNDTFGIPYKNQKVMWTCKWTQLKTAELETLSPADQLEAKLVREFMSHHYEKRPKERLAPRTALRGGKVEAFALGWSADENPDEELLYYDYCSLYPSVSSDSKNTFPTGKPHILITEDELKQLTFVEEKCLLKLKDGRNIHVKGLAQVQLLCPNMKTPFLQYRYASHLA
jgi:G:T-mismatch repair DNA endonuclease (very short patch repair protein)